MDERARRALDRAGLTLEGTPAAYADRRYLDSHDIVVAMARERVLDVGHQLTNLATAVILLRDLIELRRGADVADPYYGDDADFDGCLELLTRGDRRLTGELRRRLGADSFEA